MAIKYPWEIRSYAQGFRLSDNPRYYDAANLRFIDQSFYRDRFRDESDLIITAGTPAFVTDASGQRGLTLDNTVQGGFLPTIPWEGSAIFVVRPAIVGGTQNLRAVMFGSAVSAASNGQFDCGFASGSMLYDWKTAGGANNSRITEADETALRVLGYATDQTTRKGYRTTDGVTLAETAAVAAANNGNALSIGNHASTNPNGLRARFGNLSGVAGDTTATASSLTFFEMHFFLGNVWTEYPTEAAEFMGTLRKRYGLA